jgi:hypothetical protein
MEIMDNGEPRVALADSKGHTRALLGILQGSAMSLLYDNNGNPNIGMFAEPNGETDLSAETQTAS